MRCKWFFVCPLRGHEEQEKIDDSYRKKYCEGNWKSCKRYQLEEKGIEHSDDLLPDGSFLK